MKSSFACAIWTASILAIGLGLPTCARAQQDPMAERIETAVDWLNASLSMAAGARSRPIFAQLLPMSVSNYRQFVLSAYSEEQGLEVGKPALSAYLQRNALVDQAQKDTCFLLYNSEARDILDKSFVIPYQKRFGDAITPYAFLAAHEVGHCIEFQHYKPTEAKRRSKLQMEVSADSFAILLLRSAGASRSEILSIVDSRKNTSASHSTWKWIQPAIDSPLPSTNPLLIEDLWKTADKISETAP